MEYGSQQKKTGVHKNCYDAVFDETFTFRITGGSAKFPLVLTVMDWETIGSHDTVGCAEVAVEVLQSALAGDPTGPLQLPVLDAKSKKQRTGHDKKPCFLQARFLSAARTALLPPPFSPRAPGWGCNNAGEGGRLQLGAR